MFPEAMESLICVLIFFALLGGWKLFDHLKNLNRNENMYKKIGWIIEKEQHNRCYSERVRLRDMDLLSYLFDAQNNLKIPKDLCIDYSSEIEKAAAEEILNSHKKDVLIKYFSDDLSINKKICRLDSLEYYFFSLYCFIYNELKEYKYQDKIYADKENTDKTHFSCQLTEYGRTYYKLYLITNMYIVNNEKTSSLFEYIDPKLKNHIMEYLRTNTIQFWTYRP